MQLVTVNALAASSNDEKLVDTRIVDFARLKSSSRFDRIGSLSSDVFEQRTSTESEPFLKYPLTLANLYYKVSLLL